MQRGKKIIRMPSAYYTSKFNEEGGGVVEQQMKKSIHIVSSLWFSAWVDAGQPILDEFSIVENVETDTIKITKQQEGRRQHDY